MSRGICLYLYRKYLEAWVGEWTTKVNYQIFKLSNCELIGSGNRADFGFMALFENVLYNYIMQKHNLNFSLSVSVLKEGDTFIAYSPVLDLATVGKTFEEAKIHFEEAVNIFFEEIIEKGTVDEVLSDLGWQKIKNTYAPPIAVSHQLENFCIPNYVY